MAICNGCGGKVGRDCFNPVKCEWIAQQQMIDQSRQQDNPKQIKHFVAWLEDNYGITIPDRVVQEYIKYQL